MDWAAVFIVLITLSILSLIFVVMYIFGSRSHQCPNCGKKAALRETKRVNENQKNTYSYRELKCEFCEHIVIKATNNGGGCGGCGG